jgi:phytanoyl-CoA hydroxylase
MRVKEKANKIEPLSDAFDRDGFVRIPQGAPATYEDPSDSDSLKSMRLMERHDPFFREFFAENERLKELSRMLLHCRDVKLAFVQWFDKPPLIGSPTPAHQDNIFDPFDPPDALTFWVALDTVDEDNACLRYVRGSHLGSLREHADSPYSGFSKVVSDYTGNDRANEVPMLLQPGDIAVHHFMTIHRTDPNRSDRHRRGIGFRVKSTRAKALSERQCSP